MENESRGRQEEEESKRRVLTQGTPSITASIADAVVAKNEGIYFLCRPDGRVPMERDHGYGLYSHDCRFLDGYELKLDGHDPVPLVSSAVQGFMSIFQLTNPDMHVDGTLIEENTIGIKWERVLSGEDCTLSESLTFRNFATTAVSLPVDFAFRAQFHDVFAVRGLLTEGLGRAEPPRWRNEQELRFLYRGSDGLDRALTIRFSHSPEAAGEASARFVVRLGAREAQTLRVWLEAHEAPCAWRTVHDDRPRRDASDVKAVLEQRSREWQRSHARVTSSSVMLNMVVDRAVRDLCMLRTRLEGCEFYAAGVPWFATLFGRDSIITAMQSLAFNSVMAAHTLQTMAKYQGRTIDEWRDEQPGKILHELRVGEMARRGDVPHTPYYGTVDATPLFLVLLGRYTAWTGDLRPFEMLSDNVERALTWIGKYGDHDGDGYVEYQSESGKGLVNQGWKDSGNAIVTEDGSIAVPPIALVEVQAYVYLAKTSLAEIYDRVGRREHAARLRAEADDLRARFNHDFWLDDLGFYALALQGNKRPLRVISSNAGHVLWAGMADADKAERTASRLTAADVFSGWGIRTLSTSERAYSPLGYHVGTVWPHDNAFAAAGLRRYGFDRQALLLFEGMLAAARFFEHYRLPEVFAGFARDEYDVPVRYPIACHPQAWASGSVLFMIETLLGLQPDALAKRLLVVRPLLPHHITRLELADLRVGRATVDLTFVRGRDGAATVEVGRTDGDLEVVVSKVDEKDPIG